MSSESVVNNINALLNGLGKSGKVEAVTDGFVDKNGNWGASKPQTLSETVWYSVDGKPLGSKNDAISKLISPAGQTNVIKKSDKDNTNGVMFYTADTAKAEAEKTVKAKVNALTASDFAVTEQKG